MAIKASGQITIVDLSDSRQLSVYLTSNLPKTQILDQDTNTYTPNWATTNLTITPNIFLNQTAIALGTTGLSVSFKRRDGSGAEASLATGETVSNGVLTVKQNTLSSSSSGLVTYICYISYVDPQTDQTVYTQTDISFSLVKNAVSAKLASISGEQIFKYNGEGTLVGATSITLNATTQGVSQIKWQYKNSAGNFVDYPTTADNASITSSVLVVKPAHAVFNNNVATIKLSTEDSDIYDTISISKLYDGADGQDGAAGVGGLSVIVGNEAQSIVADASTNHPISAATTITIPITAYKGTAITSCTLTTPANLPSGMTASQATSNNVVTLTLSITKGATLGNADSGTIPLVITSNGQTVNKTFSWSKAVKGATGASGQDGEDGENAVVFTVYAPNGTVFINQEGTLTLATQAYDGSTPITSGATYKWEKYASGSWSQAGTAATLTVQGSTVANVATYRCTMTYNGKTYQDVITLEDKSDSMVASIMSTGGDVFKNGKGNTTLICKLFANGNETDGLLVDYISTTAPSSPTSGQLWYKIDASAKTVTLMKYSGSSWTAATEKQDYTYNWYRMDYNGNALDDGEVFKSGKVIYVNDTEVDTKTTFICEVE